MTIRLPEPTDISDPVVRDYIHQLLRVLQESFSNVDNQITTFNNTHTRIATGAFDGGGLPIENGSTAVVRIPFSGLLSSCSILCDVVGDIQVDIWKAPFGSYQPDVGDSIVGGNYPTITGDDQFLDSNLTDWTLQVTANDVLLFNIVSCSTITNAIISLEIIPT